MGSSPGLLLFQIDGFPWSFQQVLLCMMWLVTIVTHVRFLIHLTVICNNPTHICISIANVEFSIGLPVACFPSMTPHDSPIFLAFENTLLIGVMSLLPIILPFNFIKLNIESSEEFVNLKVLRFLAVVVVICRFPFIIIEKVKVFPQLS